MKSEELAKYGGFFNVFYSFPCPWHQFSGFDFLSGFAKFAKFARHFLTLHARGRAGKFKNRGDT